MKYIDSLTVLRVGAYVDGLNVYHGDLRLPAQHARTCVPTGTVNPRGGSTARHLRGEPNDGVGGHWWYRLTAEDFFRHQLPEVVGGARKPAGW